MLVALASLVVGFAHQEFFDELFTDELVRFEYSEDDHRVEGIGPERSFEYVADFSGRLHLWATSLETDLVLRVQDGERTWRKEDDRSGGAPSPFLALDVEVDDYLLVHVAARQASDADVPTGVVAVPTGVVEVMAASCVETDATRTAAASTLRDFQIAQQEAQASGGYQPYRDLVKRWREIPGADRSLRLAQALLSMSSVVRGTGPRNG